jgi:signal transduction histidine kinase
MVYIFLIYHSSSTDPLMFFIGSSDFNERVSMRAAEFCEQVILEMGAELHDEVIQKLTSMSLYIERIERAAGDTSEILSLVTRMRGDFDNITRSVRAISNRFHPVQFLGTSFNTSIAQLCDSMQRPGNGHISFSSMGEELSLSQLSFIYLYRIVQELIHNAFKHSAAWKVNVSVSWTPAVLVIEVEDDGTSHAKMDDLTALLHSKHNTLQMRAQAINATIKYAKGKKGLLAQVEYPLFGNTR